jgi:hypothetical protein
LAADWPMPSEEPVMKMRAMVLLCCVAFCLEDLEDLERCRREKGHSLFDDILTPEILMSLFT